MGGRQKTSLFITKERKRESRETRVRGREGKGRK